MPFGKGEKIRVMNDRPTILIAEDQEFLDQNVKDRLEDKNFTVELAEDGERALSIYKETKPEIMILDLKISKLDGISVAREIRKIDQNTPIIIVSTQFIMEDIVEGLNIGCNDYLKKPFGTEELLFKINNLFNREKLGVKTNIKKFPAILPIRMGNRTILLKSTKITYVLASGYYAEIFTEDKKYVIRESLNNLIEFLNPNLFCRVHRSAIVNLHYAKEIVHSNFSEIDVRMQDDKLIKISKSQKKDFLNLINCK